MRSPVLRSARFSATMFVTLGLIFSLAHVGPAERPARAMNPHDAALLLGRTQNPVGDASSPAPDRQNRTAAQPDYGKLPLSFEANQGQTDNRVQFLSRGSGYMLFLTRGEAVLALSKAAPRTKDRRGSLKANRAEAKSERAVLRMKWLGAKPDLKQEGVSQLPGRVNYYAGKDRAKWFENIPTYGKVNYAGVYEGIDMIFYGNQRELEYDFILQPGADPRQIRLAFEGADKLELDAAGNLRASVSGVEVLQQAPVVYQEMDGVRQTIAAKYILKGRREVAFELGAYDVTKPLVIDPILKYLTYLGGKGLDEVLGIAVDSAGNAHVTGETISADFPSQSQHESEFGSIFVTKFDPTGSTPLYSTILDGEAEEAGRGIALDPADGAVCIVGVTVSKKYPVTGDAFQPEPVLIDFIEDEAVVSKLNSSGQLTYSTYLGGKDLDQGNAIALDRDGRIYVTGLTYSGNFPEKNAYQGFGVSGVFSSAKVFVTVFERDGRSLVYSTALKGADYDEGFGIAVDAAGAAYVTGRTDSSGFPVKNAFQPESGSPRGTDAFISKIDPSRAGEDSLVYSTYLGGAGTDIGLGIAVTPDGRAHVTGVTGSVDFPLKNALDSLNQVNEAFVTTLKPDGTLVVSTFLGGTGVDEGRGIALDSGGSIYLTGLTGSPNFPRALAFQSALSGAQDAFVTKLRLGGEAPGIVSSSFLGGSGNDTGTCIALGPGSQIFAGGITESNDLRTTKGVFQRTSDASAAATDGFVAKIFDTHIDTVGIFDPSVPQFVLTLSTVGVISQVIIVRIGRVGDQPVRGDWNGDAIDTVGTFNGGNWAIRNFNDPTGYPTTNSLIQFTFGQSGEQPVSGDWDGDGDDTVGVWNPATGEWRLTDVTATQGSTPPVNITSTFGQSGDIPVTGDWNGDGVDSIGVYRPSTGEWFLSNNNVAPDTDFIITTFGGLAGDLPVVGDWDGDGLDTVGIFGVGRDGIKFVGGTGFLLSNSNTAPAINLSVNFGEFGNSPLAGDWDGKP